MPTKAKTKPKDNSKIDKDWIRGILSGEIMDPPENFEVSVAFYFSDILNSLTSKFDIEELFIDDIKQKLYDCYTKYYKSKYPKNKITRDNINILIEFKKDKKPNYYFVNIDHLNEGHEKILELKNKEDLTDWPVTICGDFYRNDNKQFEKTISIRSYQNSYIEDIKINDHFEKYFGGIDNEKIKDELIDNFYIRKAFDKENMIKMLKTSKFLFVCNIITYLLQEIQDEQINLRDIKSNIFLAEDDATSYDDDVEYCPFYYYNTFILIDNNSPSYDIIDNVLNNLHHLPLKTKEDKTAKQEQLQLERLIKEYRKKQMSREIFINSIKKFKTISWEDVINQLLK